MYVPPFKITPKIIDLISKISEKIGISNDTYFYKLFKDECGMTPSEFKKYGMARKKETEN